MTSRSTSETKLDRMREAYRGMGVLLAALIFVAIALTATGLSW